MRTFNEAFKEVYDPVMTAKGFTRKGKIYHRLVNGKIIQMLSYAGFSHKYYTIQFEISALCEGGEFEVFMDSERLSEVFGIDEWEYVDDEYLTQLPETISLCEKYIFPYFDACTDYESYLENMNKLYHLKSRHRYDGIPLTNSMLFNLSLVLENYELAQKSRETLIKLENDYNISRWGSDICPIPSRQQWYSDLKNSYYRMKEAMDNNDREYVEAYIKSNEEHALQSYIKNFYGKRAYEKYLATKQWPLP